MEDSKFSYIYSSINGKKTSQILNVLLTKMLLTSSKNRFFFSLLHLINDTFERFPLGFIVNWQSNDFTFGSFLNV